MKPWTRGLDWTNAAIGLWLMAAPWALGTSADATSTATAVTVGALVVGVALWALAVPSSAGAEWSNVTLGAGLFLAPFVFGYTDVTAAAWNAYLSGTTVLCLAAAAVPAARRAQAARSAPADERLHSDSAR